MLPASIKVNYSYSPDKYKDIARAMGVKDEGYDTETTIKKGIEKLEGIYSKLGIPSKLSHVYKVKDEDFDEIIKSIEKSTMHIKTNPRPVSRELLYDTLKMVK